MDDVESSGSVKEDPQKKDSSSYQGVSINRQHSAQIKNKHHLQPADSEVEQSNMLLDKYVSPSQLSKSADASNNDHLSARFSAMSDRLEKSWHMPSKSSGETSSISFPLIMGCRPFKDTVKQAEAVKNISEKWSALPPLSSRMQDCNKNKEKVLPTFAVGDFDKFILKRLSPEIKANKQSLGLFPIEKLDTQPQPLSEFTKLKAKDGSLYFGQTKDGQRHGFGGLLEACGHYHEGSWRHDLRDGFGRYFSADGDFFIGQFRHDMFEGEGEYHGRDGTVYRGNFRYHKRHGFGVEVKVSGTTYQGEWVEGRRQGKGLLRYANGDTYQGNFKNNLFHGKGVYSWADGSKYEGEYSNGKYHGKGAMTLANGNRFIGDYVKGKPNGWGEFHSHDGGVYRGECAQGKPHGRGVFRNVHGKLFKQVFVDGVRVESTAL